MTGALSNYHGPAVHRMPSELLLQFVESFSIPDLVVATHVCRFWRSTLLSCPRLWANLDMVCFEARAFGIVPDLLPRSQSTPFDLSIYLPWNPVHVGAFYPALASHVHRLRRLSWHCMNYNSAAPIFKVLGSGAPILHSLDMALSSLKLPPGGLFAHLPQLSRVHWVGCPLPAALDNLSNITHLHIFQSALPSDSRLFAMFPRARSIRIDNCYQIRELGTFPTFHPLERLELSTRIEDIDPIPLDWEELRALRFTEVPILTLRNYNLAALFAACQEGIWQAKELKIHYHDDVDAVLRNGVHECRMVSFRSAPVGAQLNVQRLMYDRPCLRPISRLSLSLGLSVLQNRQGLLVPHLGLPALTVLVLLCARHKPRGAIGTIESVAPQIGSLLDPDVLATCGTLRAPNLKTLVLKYHPLRADWQDPEYTGVVDPAALAEFIGGHIQISGDGLLPELRIDSPKVRLADDAAGMTALTAVVGTIIQGL